MEPVTVMLGRRLRKLRSRVFWDRASEESTIFLAGMGRSGTTWVADLLNYDGTHRVMFEPFNPRRVKEARHFQYVQYMRHDAPEPRLVESARTILRGELRNGWVDVDNRGLMLRRRLIKDVRCNLMLRWLKTVSPQMSVVLLLRHPLAVALSWWKLGWGVEREGSDFEIVVAQEGLLRDHPALACALEQIDREDALERIVFQWCAFQLVPLTQFRDGGLTVLFYEDLLIDPQQEVEKLFTRLGRSCDWARLAPVLDRPSKTNFLDTRIGTAKGDLLNGWTQAFTGAQIARVHTILRMVGLESLYVNERPAGELPFTRGGMACRA